MTKAELEALFEQMLAEPDGAEDAALMTVRTALAAASMRPDAAQAGDAGTTAKLAAYLDGKLEPADAEIFLASLLQSPEGIYDLEAAQSLLSRVSAEKTPVPAELVAAMMADSGRHARKPIAARRNWYAHWGRAAAWAGGAIAALVLAFIAGTRMSGNPAPAPALPQTAANPPSAVAGLAPRNGSGDGAAATPDPLYTAPNPPVPITSHAVMAADYPPDSVRLQEEGTANVSYLIQADGNVNECRVIASSGFPNLDEAACAIVKKWRFKPATVLDGRPVAVWMQAAIVFQLGGTVSNPPQARGNQPPLRDDLVRRKEIPPAPPPPNAPVIPVTSHAVTAEDYPPVSVRLQEQGSVAIKYTIGIDGAVSECAVVMTSGKPRLDDAACTMAKNRWKFKPATQYGRPVVSVQTARIVFQLK